MSATERLLVARSTESILSRYLRDLTAHQVMGPSEELRAAQAVERAEVEHWVALLSYLPVATQVLCQLADDIQSLPAGERPDVPQIADLTELARAQTSQATLAPAPQARWNDLSRELAQTIRLPDLDRRWMANANRVVRDGVRAGPHSDSPADSDPLARQSFLLRVRSTDLAQQRAKHRFVEANLRLVISAAQRQYRGSLALIDVIQEGNIGLMKAVERFDHTRGYRFSTFAMWWIRHAMSRAVENTGRAVRIPTHLLAAYARASRVTEALIARTGCAPTMTELERQTRIGAKKLGTVKHLHLSHPLSLDCSLGDAAGRRFLDRLVDDESVSPYECVARKWLTEKLHRLLDTLTFDELRVIRLRFGLDDEDELSLMEIAERCQKSHEGIRQRLGKSLRKMRRRMDTD